MLVKTECGQFKVQTFGSLWPSKRGKYGKLGKCDNRGKYGKVVKWLNVVNEVKMRS